MEGSKKPAETRGMRSWSDSSLKREVTSVVKAVSRLGRKLALAGALALLVPATASAATASVSNGRLIVTGDDRPDYLSVTHAPRTLNPKDTELFYKVDEMFAQYRHVSPGPGCQKINPEFAEEPTAVYCSRSGVSSIVMSLGGRADSGFTGSGAERRPDGKLYPDIPVPVVIRGGDGIDSLGSETAGPRATLYGGRGDDYIDADTRQAGLGFVRNPITAYGGPGNDTIEGTCKRADRLFGESGNDQIWSRDGIRDLVNGGAGFDSANVDRLDTRRSINQVFGGTGTC